MSDRGGSAWRSRGHEAAEHYGPLLGLPFPLLLGLLGFEAAGPYAGLVGGVAGTVLPMMIFSGRGHSH